MERDNIIMTKWLHSVDCLVRAERRAIGWQLNHKPIPAALPLRIRRLRLISHTLLQRFLAGSQTLATGQPGR